MIAIIPSRLNSQRFPQKALYPILGIPMIVMVCMQAKKANCTPVVGTPDQIIADVVREYGFYAIVTKPCESAHGQIALLNEYLVEDFVIGIGGDEPAMNPKSIHKIIAAHKQHPTSTIIGYKHTTTPNDPDMIKFVVNDNNKILFASRGVIPYGAPPGYKYKFHTSLCLFSKEHLIAMKHTQMPLEYIENVDFLRFIELELPMIGVHVEQCRSVDRLQHVALAEKSLKDME